MKTKAYFSFLLFLLIIFSVLLFSFYTSFTHSIPYSHSPQLSYSVNQVMEGAYSQIGVTKLYDPAYVKLSYPNGDVEMERGVCSDVVIRAFRKAGVDLQLLVHEDMKKNFGAYPKIWGLKGPDTHIDHRRVPNLMKFFERKGKSLTLSKEAKNYLPGDVVVWRLDNGLVHTGLISERKNSGDTPLVIHNIGAGAQQEDILFEYKILGHYRYF